VILEAADTFVVLFNDVRDWAADLHISFEEHFFVFVSHFSIKLHVSFFVQIEISVQFYPF